MDKISADKRSWNMSRISSRNTKPEKAVRSLLHRMGYRFRLHRKDLPGKPDIVLPKYRTVVFVHGCFGTDMKTANTQPHRNPIGISGLKNSRRTLSGT